MKFEDLRLAEPLLRAVATAGYTHPTPIQAEAIPHVIAGRDLLGCAQTGTGKTAAFALPILHRLSQRNQPAGHTSTGQKGKSRRSSAGPAAKPRTLILCPTRELGTQIAESMRSYGTNLRLKQVVIFGGVSQHPQVRALRTGVDVIIATPGRLLDLMNQGHVDLSGIEIFVLDEADRMLDMGFIPDIRRISTHVPKVRQTLMFSATMPRDIRALAETLLRNPVNVQVNMESSSAPSINQSVYHVARQNKPALLANILRGEAAGRTLVFTRTRHGADRVVRGLTKAGIRAVAIHGDKSQNARTRAMLDFKSATPPVLVATDIASRGIDVDDIQHVINFDMPNTAETYVHRIGRTARAGASGTAVAFCDPSEMSNLRAIERFSGSRIKVRADLPELTSTAPPESAGRDQSRGRSGSRKPFKRVSKHAIRDRSGGHAKPASAGRGKNRTGGRRGGSEAAGSEHALSSANPGRVRRRAGTGKGRTR